MRRETITLDQAQQLQHQAEVLMSDHEYQVLSSEVLELVHLTDCSAYDCEFVALALHLDTKLVTMDGKLLRAFSDVAVAMNTR